METFSCEQAVSVRSEGNDVMGHVLLSDNAEPGTLYVEHLCVVELLL